MPSKKHDDFEFNPEQELANVQEQSRETPERNTWGTNFVTGVGGLTGVTTYANIEPVAGNTDALLEFFGIGAAGNTRYDTLTVSPTRPVVDYTGEYDLSGEGYVLMIPWRDHAPILTALYSFIDTHRAEYPNVDDDMCIYLNVYDFVTIFRAYNATNRIEHGFFNLEFGNGSVVEICAMPGSEGILWLPDMGNIARATVRGY